MAAPDRPWPPLLVAGVLALHGLGVRAANVSGEDAVAVEVFTVEVAGGSWPTPPGSAPTWPPCCRAGWPSGERLTDGSPPIGSRPSAAHLPGCDVRVDNDASATSTVIKVRAPDEVGLLHRITRSLFEADLDVVSARVHAG